MSEELYIRLREFMDRLPGGYPATESGVEVKILKKLFTPEDAELVMKMYSSPEPVSDLAKRWGLEPDQFVDMVKGIEQQGAIRVIMKGDDMFMVPAPEPARVVAARWGMETEGAQDKLDDMADRGLILRVRMGDMALYMPIQFVVGVYEFQNKSLDRELCELMEEYLPHLGAAMLETPTFQVRIVPVNSALDPLPSVQTYDRSREIIAAQDLIAVSTCICKKEQGLMGNECDRPQEVCMTFGRSAQSNIERGAGREITREDALEILDLAEKSALVLSPDNNQQPSFICCCCGCCCGVLRILKLMPRPAEHVHATYRAEIDPSLCAACSDCVERCQMEAIKEGEGTMEIDEGRCIGCGLCVPSCPEEAITLKKRPDADEPPLTRSAMLEKISRERGMI